MSSSQPPRSRPTPPPVVDATADGAPGDDSDELSAAKPRRRLNPLRRRGRRAAAPAAGAEHEHEDWDDEYEDDYDDDLEDEYDDGYDDDDDYDEDDGEDLEYDDGYDDDGPYDDEPYDDEDDDDEAGPAAPRRRRRLLPRPRRRTAAESEPTAPAAPIEPAEPTAPAARPARTGWSDDSSSDERDGARNDNGYRGDDDDDDDSGYGDNESGDGNYDDDDLPPSGGTATRRRFPGRPGGSRPAGRPARSPRRRLPVAAFRQGAGQRLTSARTGVSGAGRRVGTGVGRGWTATRGGAAAGVHFVRTHWGRAAYIYLGFVGAALVLTLLLYWNSGFSYDECNLCGIPLLLSVSPWWLLVVPFNVSAWPMLLPLAVFLLFAGLNAELINRYSKHPQPVYTDWT